MVRGDSSRDLLIPQTLEVKFTAIEKVAFSPSQKGQISCQVRVLFSTKNRADYIVLILELLLQDFFSRILLGQKDGEKIEGYFFVLSNFWLQFVCCSPWGIVALKFPQILQASKKKVINGHGLSAPIRT